VEELKAELEKTKKERDEYKSKFEAKDRELWELKNQKTEKKSFGEAVANEVERYGVTAVKTGVEEGSKVFPIIDPTVGGLIGAGYGAAGGLIHVGAEGAERLAEEGKEVGAFVVDKGMTFADGAIKHGKDVGKYATETSIKVADGAAKHGKDVGAFAVNKGIDVLAGAKDLLEGWTGTRSEKDEIKYLKRDLEEKERRIKELTEDKEEKTQEIKELRQEKKELKERIRELEKRLGESQEKLFAQVEETRATSPMPYLRGQQ